MDISVVSVFLLIMNNTALNIHVYLFVSTYIFSYLEYKKKTCICWPCANSVFNLLRNYEAVFTMPFYISAVYESSNFHIRFFNPFKRLLFSLFF